MTKSCIKQEYACYLHERIFFMEAALQEIVQEKKRIYILHFAINWSMTIKKGLPIKGNDSAKENLSAIVRL